MAELFNVESPSDERWDILRSDVISDYCVRRANFFSQDNLFLINYYLRWSQDEAEMVGEIDHHLHIKGWPQSHHLTDRGLHIKRPEPGWSSSPAPPCTTSLLLLPSPNQFGGDSPGRAEPETCRLTRPVVSWDPAQTEVWTVSCYLQIYWPLHSVLTPNTSREKISSSL